MLFRRIAAALGAAALVALPATAARADDGPAPQDVAYLQTAHQANLAEIAGGRAAWQKTTDPKVKNLAVTFMRDHILLNAALYQTARSLRVTLAPGPTAEQLALVHRYQVAEPTAFDEYYIITQLEMHRAALRVGATAIEHGNDPAVRQLAQDAAPVIAAHHRLLRNAEAAEGIAGYTSGSARP